MPLTGDAVMIAQPLLEVFGLRSIGSPDIPPPADDPDGAHRPGGERRQRTDEREDGEHRLIEHGREDHGAGRRHARTDQCGDGRERRQR